MYVNGILLRNSVVAAAMVVVASAAAPAAADTIDLGLAGQYAAFGLGSTTGVGSADSVTLNTAEVYGNTAVGADTSSSTAAGNGTFQKGFITGNLVVDGPLPPQAIP